jgi:hypothetical protein
MEHPLPKAELRRSLQRIERMNACESEWSAQIEQNATPNAAFSSILVCWFLQIPLYEGCVCLACHKMGIRENLSMKRDRGLYAFNNELA